MTIWSPQLEPAATPLYLAIADALTRDVDSGRVLPGTRLPTHRELAKSLGVNVGTVTRAYKEAARRGLLDGEVGRGSFIRHLAPRSSGAPASSGGAAGSIDLAFNLPVGGPSSQERSLALAALSRRSDLGQLFDAYHPAGLMGHREAGTRWIQRSKLEAPPDRVLVTGGAQHAMAVTLATLTRAGDVLLTESLTYPGTKALARLLHLRTQGLVMDEHGLVPEAFEAACRSGAAKVLYCQPTLHNPTGTVLPEDRRRRIADIARKHGVSILEDDTYGFLWPDATPPIAAFAPERVYHVSALSKSLSAGLRVGYLLAPTEPAGIVERLLASTSAIAWMAAPLMAELAALWIADGTAERVVQWKRGESQARQTLARRLLGSPASPSSPLGCHYWLPLPRPWRSDEFVARARQRGVAVTAPGPFAVGRANAPHAVRVCLGTPPSRELLERGVATLAEILAGASDAHAPIV